MRRREVLAVGRRNEREIKRLSTSLGAAVMAGRLSIAPSRMNLVTDELISHDAKDYHVVLHSGVLAWYLSAEHPCPAGRIWLSEGSTRTLSATPSRAMHPSTCVLTVAGHQLKEHTRGTTPLNVIVQIRLAEQEEQ